MPNVSMSRLMSVVFKFIPPWGYPKYRAGANAAKSNDCAALISSLTGALFSRGCRSEKRGGLSRTPLRVFTSHFQRSKSRSVYLHECSWYPYFTLCATKLNIGEMDIFLLPSGGVVEVLEYPFCSNSIKRVGLDAQLRDVPDLEADVG